MPAHPHSAYGRDMWEPVRHVPRCPLRPGDACSLCVPGASGPENCPTVAEVMRDPELRQRLVELHHEVAESG